MSSFLQRRLKDEAGKSTPKADLASLIDSDDAPEPAARIATPPADAPRSRESAAPSAPRRAFGQATPAVQLETGYTVPGKVRTTPKVAQLRKQLRSKLLGFEGEADQWHRGDPEKEKIIAGRIQTVLQKMDVQLAQSELAELTEGLLDDLLGFGAIQPLVQDPNCSEIMVNGPDVIFGEFKGKLMETEIVFDDEDHLRFTARRIVRPLGRDLSRTNPMVDARLPDGSRVHVVSDPSALNGTTITIRKFPAERITVEHLINWKSITRELAQFMEACVVSRLNIVVSGGTGSGKTTLLNVLSSYIPEDERIITIEDSAELQLAQRHVVRLETAPPIPGSRTDGRLEIRDLVKGSLRMRPDRLVIGECRSGEALDMLQAMNTGHDGSLTTVHSNSPRDAIARLETLCMMAGMDLPVLTIRQQIAGAVDIIVQVARLKDGSRKVVQVTEIQGMEGENVTMQDLFVYRTAGQTDMGFSHEGGGRLEPTGFRPKTVDQFKQYGFNLPARIFQPPKD